MGYSDEDRKRRKKKKKHSRSRSRSPASRHSSKHKTKRPKHKRDVSPPRRHRSRSRSLSPPRKRDSRSRSVSLPRKRPDSKLRRSHSGSPSSSRGSSSRPFDERIHSRDRRSRSRERYKKSSRRKKSRSRSKESSRDSRASSMDRRKSPGKDKDKSFERINDPCKDIPGFKDMTPMEQAQMRMQMALKAAAAADEKLKGQGPFDSTSGRSAEEQLRFSRALDDINSDSFAPTSFLSSRTAPAASSSDSRSVAEMNHEAAIFGSIDDVFELKPELMPKIVYKDPESFAHPNLNKTVEEKMPRWIEKLTAMRRRKLEGDL